MRSWLVMAGLLFSASAFAQSPSPQERLNAIAADPVALRQAVEAGKQVTVFCANCHGENGVSAIPDVPNLAGQNPDYLLEQIRKFGAGERVNPFMQGLIKVLKEDERLQAAHYYASMPVPPSPANSALVAHGKMLFTKLCVRCHGERAHGGELFPRLAGQQLPYLQSSIQRYRDGTGIRNDKLMAIATSTLKNDDIKAISHYLTQLP